MSGSSKLTPEQSDWYLRKFGERYVAVQEQPQVASRAERRRRRFGNGRRAQRDSS